MNQYDQHVRDLKALTAQYWYHLHCCILRDLQFSTGMVNHLQQILPPVVLNINTRPWTAYQLG